jgi:hypothetical protein
VTDIRGTNVMEKHRVRVAATHGDSTIRTFVPGGQPVKVIPPYQDQSLKEFNEWLDSRS